MIAALSGVVVVVGVVSFVAGFSALVLVGLFGACWCWCVGAHALCGGCVMVSGEMPAAR